MEDKLRESIASLMKDKGQREKLAQLLVEYVEPKHVTVDFISMLLDTRALNVGDILVKKLRKGIKVHTLVPGSIHLKSEITVSERMNYILDGADVGINVNQWELDSGELGTVESMKREMQAKLRDYFMGKVFTALTTIWTAGNTPNNFTAIAGSVTATALENAIDNINKTAGGVKAIIGSRAAMTPITKFAAFWKDPSGNDYAYVPERIQQIMETGMLGNYYGAPLVVIEQEYDNPEDYNKLIPEDKILVVGQHVGTFVTYGDVKNKEWTDNRPTPPYWNFELYQQFGMIIDNAQGIHVITVA
jgi:hypothetical protein